MFLMLVTIPKNTVFFVAVLLSLLFLFGLPYIPSFPQTGCWSPTTHVDKRVCVLPWKSSGHDADINQNNLVRLNIQAVITCRGDIMEHLQGEMVHGKRYANKAQLFLVPCLRYGNFRHLLQNPKVSKNLTGSNNYN